MIRIVLAVVLILLAAAEWAPAWLTVGGALGALALVIVPPFDSEEGSP